jgi:hypothetical protein
VSVSGIFKICLFTLADESFFSDYVPDYLKPLARGWQRTLAVLGIKKRREAAPFARDNQLRVKVPVLVDSKQPVPDLAFFQERPADELAQSLFETKMGRGRYMKANLIETAKIQQRG